MTKIIDGKDDDNNQGKLFYYSIKFNWILINFIKLILLNKFHLKQRKYILLYQQ